MVNNTLSSYAASTPSIQSIEQTKSADIPLLWKVATQPAWLVFAAAVFLVSVPVFIEAPLVRMLPWLSLTLTGGWVWLSLKLMSRPFTHTWGDLLLGFSWSWLAGSIYWGWFRWEPLWHLPVESIGLPFALWCLSRNWGKIGNWFYLGSLFGTVLTDMYFYLVDLIPYWREIMQVEPADVSPILQGAVAQVQTPWGQGWAIALVLVLLTVGILPLAYKQPTLFIMFTSSTSPYTPLLTSNSGAFTLFAIIGC
ncbi:DUF3120 domain-containing protein [Scytonema sp. NUACC21]